MRTGGAEGKLLQSVFPYRYAVWDAKFAPLPALLAQPSELSPLLTNESRGLLWSEWRRFWAAAPVFVDKTPENFLMAPFLQALLGRSRVSFVFVMRHPLAWALVAAKWGCAWRPIGEPPDGEAARARRKAPSLECIEHLLRVWLETHEALGRQLGRLSSAVALHAESDEWLARPAWLAHVGHGATPSAPDEAPPPGWSETQRAFRSASHAYVHCFLRGWAARRVRVQGTDCAAGGLAESSAVARSRWLEAVDARIGARVRALGYSMELQAVRRSCCESEWADWGVSAGDAAAADGARANNNPGRAGAGPGAIPQRPLGLRTGSVALLVSTSFLSGYNGMQQRAAQLAAATERAGYEVHYVSLGRLNSTEECTRARPAVVCHAAGDADAQYRAFVSWVREARAVPSFVLVGFTSLTLELARVLQKSSPSASFDGWHEDGRYDPEHVPKAHLSLKLLKAAAADFPAAAPLLFTDDIHFHRASQILTLAGAEPRPAQARVLASARALELEAYSRARVREPSPFACALHTHTHTHTDTHKPHPAPGTDRPDTYAAKDPLTAPCSAPSSQAKRWGQNNPSAIRKRSPTILAGASSPRSPREGGGTMKARAHSGFRAMRRA